MGRVPSPQRHYEVCGFHPSVPDAHDLHGQIHTSAIHRIMRTPVHLNHHDAKGEDVARRRRLRHGGDLRGGVVGGSLVAIADMGLGRVQRAAKTKATEGRGDISAIDMK